MSKFEVGSYVKYTPSIFSNEAFGFIIEITELRCKVHWIGRHEGIITSPMRDNLVLLAKSSKLTSLLFL
jgi:hypothetical protein